MNPTAETLLAGAQEALAGCQFQSVLDILKDLRDLPLSREQRLQASLLGAQAAFDAAENALCLEYCWKAESLLKEDASPDAADPLAGILQLQAYTLYRTGEDYVKAEALYNQALSLCKENADPAGEVRVLQKLALMHRFLNHKKKALEISARILESEEYKKVLEEDPGLRAESLRIHAWCTEDPEAAWKEIQRAAETVENNPGSVSFRTAGDVYYTFSVLAYQRQDINKAKEACRKALQYLEDCYGKDSVELCNALNQLGACCSRLDEGQEALDSYRRSYQIRKNHYGTKNLLTSISSGNYGKELSRQKQYAQAEAVLQENVDIRRSLLPEQKDSIWLARGLAELAVCQMDSSRPEKAEPNFREALSLFQSLNDTRNVLLCQRKLAEILLNRNDPLADNYLKQTWKLAEECLPAADWIRKQLTDMMQRAGASL